MFIKYNSYNKSATYLSYNIESFSILDFKKQFNFSELIPLRSNDEIFQFKKSQKIHVLTAIYNHEVGSYFFFNLINNIQNGAVCLLYNEYKMLNEMKDYLTKKYDEDIIISEANPEIGFLQLSDSLIDPESIFDWYNLWGHGFNAWIIEKNDINLFKDTISNSLSNKQIETFLDSSFLKIEFADIHESIRFISLEKSKINEVFKQIKSRKLS